MDGDDAGSDINYFKIKGAATRLFPPKKQPNPRDDCTICLDPISERAIAVPCNHWTFDFCCLVSWLQTNSTCPLCKADVTAVQYDWRAPDEYETFQVKQTESAKETNIVAQQNRRGSSLPSSRRDESTPSTRDRALGRRRHMYRNRLYSLHVGANSISQYRNFTPEEFAASTSMQSRARAFLRRELEVFSFLGADRRCSRSYLNEYIVAVLKKADLRGADGKAEELLKDFLGIENTRQLLHEMESFLRSPYARLEDWDTHVQYADQLGRRRKS